MGYNPRRGGVPANPTFTTITATGDIRSGNSIIAAGGHYVGNSGEYSAVTDKVHLPNTGAYIFSDSTDCRSGVGAQMVPDGVGRIAFRNGAEAQTIILSETFIDNSNKSQLELSTVAGVVTFQIVEAGSEQAQLNGYRFDQQVEFSAPPKFANSIGAPADAGTIASYLPFVSVDGSTYYIPYYH